MKKNIFIFTLLFGINIGFSQNISNSKKIDSILKIDFLNYNYKFLDKSFKIVVKKDVYDKSFKDYKFTTNENFKYADSLSVVLMAEFNDWDVARIAKLRITYTWERVGYYLWKDESEILELAKRVNIDQPYRLQELIKNNDEKISNEIDNLRKKLFLNFGENELKTMPLDQLLSFSFKNNPNIIKFKEESVKRSNIRKFIYKHKRQPTLTEEKNLAGGCGKENCCQKPIKI
jgi:hypothetical protein